MRYFPLLIKVEEEGVILKLKNPSQLRNSKALNPLVKGQSDWVIWAGGSKCNYISINTLPLELVTNTDARAPQDLGNVAFVNCCDH